MEWIKKNNEEILVCNQVALEDGTTVPLLSYPLLTETGIVKHCFTTRMGGVSKGIFSSMNLSFTRGDEKEDVMENYKRLAEALGVSLENFVFTDQTHTTNVLKVTEKDAGKGILRERDYQDVDGLITNVKGLVLSTFFADCVPLYFVDPVHEAIGMSHSGWRGTVRRMGKATIEAMEQAFGTKPSDLICAIGPSICQDCYEVSEDVAEEFKSAFPGYEREILLEKGNGKYQLDLWKANEIVLEEAGVEKEHIAVTNLCTCCNPNLLFSHRASHGKRGNLGGFLCLK
ncbi:MAG: peptidoglycan editing factor PgeF [Roseburia sp.]|uniref:peptidoglycan editing factor PgeF n=1 Tax=Roseburia sp. 831b TaxID=1261635 RepID=UPI00095268FD|nr:peptidoglycan editing factor PgeF [Roseburia sp. 831b]MCI5919526.1 peptidoglycan editing factor PgeF [Roseburia sp.]MDD6215348.1 peptidoglycan editing factor PgeF [Roseburia sp.]MDY5881983.1 peptidoglycan editing factor PgeF [Roseburia sp.]WVK73591.1 peptidoglycan editing factor PgeF [Roseburia sp. 831b]